MLCVRTYLLCALLMVLLAAGLSAQEKDVPRLPADSTFAAWHAVLADDDSAIVLCAWSRRDVHAARIHATMLRFGQCTDIVAVQLSFPDEGCEDVRPAALLLDEGTVLVLWQHSCPDSRRILAARFDHSLHQLGEPVCISGEANALMPAAGRRGAGDAFAAWQDYRGGGPDIYARRFDAEGNPADDAVLINDDASSAMQGPPRLAADMHGDFILLWPDNRVDNMWKFYAARFDGESAGSNMLVDSAQRKAMTTLAAAVMLPGDSAVFAWKDYRAGHSNIYLRRADLARGTFTEAMHVNDDSTDRWQRLVVLDSDGRGNVVACWEDYRNTEWNQQGDVYLQCFAPDGTPLGANIRVNDRTDRIPRKMPQIAMLRDGRYLITWHQGEDGNFTLQGQWFRFPAERIGRNFCISCTETRR
ncbi:MAG: hypothetical protein JXA28_02090 [Bacteroidetes bacterium]|nr:hypothetical protein [Bacteroidota bacterium]